MPPRVLLLSAYSARSHTLWRERLQGLFPDYHWTCLTLPPRHFNWTIRGNSLLWAFSQRQLLEQPYDILLATSMVDLSSLRGFVPALSKLPTIMYFHENQFVYPQPQSSSSQSKGVENVEPVLVPLYGALAADRIVFNSHYNRDSFIEGAADLFRRLPDSIPDTVMAHLQNSTVIPVPIPARAMRQRATGNILEVVWNHRWEYDKGIDLLLAICQVIQSRELPLRLHVVGEQFRQAPVALQTVNAVLDAHARHTGVSRGHFGFIQARAEYEALLSSCDVVLSTALHDFQGLAVQEACVAGCTPLAPDDLVYPEYLDKAFLYPRLADNNAIAHDVCQRLQAWQSIKADGLDLPKAPLTDYLEKELKPRYQALFDELLQSM